VYAKASKINSGWCGRTWTFPRRVAKTPRSSPRRAARAGGPDQHSLAREGASPAPLPGVTPPRPGRTTSRGRYLEEANPSWKRSCTCSRTTTDSFTTCRGMTNSGWPARRYSSCKSLPAARPTRQKLDDTSTTSGIRTPYDDDANVLREGGRVGKGMRRQDERAGGRFLG